VHFGNEPVYSNVLDAWFIPDGRLLHIADDRKGTRRWLTAAEQLAGAKDEAARMTTVVEQVTAMAEHAKAEFAHAKAEAERATAEAGRAIAEAERERQARLELERRLAELEKRER
jgi:hypothetical protein